MWEFAPKGGRHGKTMLSSRQQGTVPSCIALGMAIAALAFAAPTVPDGAMLLLWRLVRCGSPYRLPRLDWARPCKLALARGCSSSLAKSMWQPVGCDFSGFFVELLGYLVPLSRRSSVRLAVDLGACSDETMEQLLPDEAAALRLASSRFRELPYMHDILVEHSEPCTWQIPGGEVRYPSAPALCPSRPSRSLSSLAAVITAQSRSLASKLAL